MIETIDKIKTFNTELGYIKNNKYIENTKIILSMIPDYFFKIPASSTGKYHPSFSLGEGGLVRHTKVAVKIGYTLLQSKTTNNFTDNEKDLIIISLILHDSFKSGVIEEKYCRVDHPLIVTNFLKENKDKFTFSDQELNYICECINTHMGEFNTDYRGNVVLPLPQTKHQRFVHMCDLLSSKKFLNINFNGNEIIE
ncbi:MAG: hypothetical protein E7166_02915 [Firmicutes bacterium]|nr:hypothetical protein [Bacillota bacterium]